MNDILNSDCINWKPGNQDISLFFLQFQNQGEKKSFKFCK